MYLSYDNMLTYGFYVSGDNDAPTSTCKGSASHAMRGNTSRTTVDSPAQCEPDLTRIHWPVRFWTEPRLHEPMGRALLENSKGYDHKKILHFYYGADIKLLQATGACVTLPTDTDPGRRHRR